MAMLAKLLQSTGASTRHPRTRARRLFADAGDARDRRGASANGTVGVGPLRADLCRSRVMRYPHGVRRPSPNTALTPHPRMLAIENARCLRSHREHWAPPARAATR